MAEPTTRGPDGHTKSSGSRTRSTKTRSTPSSKDEPRSPVSEPDSAVHVIGMTAIDRDLMIAEAAYYLSERRNFEGGHELDDWLAAENEIDRQLSGRLSS